MRYLYAVICRTKGCGWSDPDVSIVQHRSLAEARKDYRESNDAKCPWCGERASFKIVRRPVVKWEDAL